MTFFILSNNWSSALFFSISLIFWRIREFTFFEDSKIWCICLCLSFNSSINRSSKRRVNASVLSFFFSDWYAILKSNSAKNSAHLTCCSCNFLIVMKYFKILWSMSTLINNSIDCNSARYCSKHLMMINNSLS
jgi:hypothetical protein